MPLSNYCYDSAPMHSGVPHVSVHLPMLFTMYIKTLSATIDSHSIIHHSFADDLQFQMSATPDRMHKLLHCMSSSTCDVKTWTTANIHEINKNKIELMLISSKKNYASP